MIGQILVGAMALILGLIIYGFLWLRFLWRGGRKPETDNILEYGPAALGAAFASFIMLGMAVLVPYAIVAGILRFFGIELWPYP
jgi:hypothetical protein